ncbi:MAG: hypothetical protein KatS3mg089_0029 [Patescibacteria group bacterium]|nr:MAG: hypothetical protein KatS3mg089_0029 [Patescibacteria group bacterium]
MLDGMYEFTGLPRGTYTITITEPNGYKAYPSVSKQQVIDLNETQRNWRNDFGINRVYSITGRVYADANQDGSYSAADDVAIVNQGVSLTGSSSASVVTASDGVYSFSRLEPGEYFVSTTPSSDYTVLTSLPLRVVITSSDVANQDIRFYGKYTISGVVFVDEDDSKTKNNQEQNYPANPQIAVTSSPTGAPLPQVVNNADGSYQVTGLISGEYTVAYSALPLGYYVFHPRPAFYAPRVGVGCSPAPQSPGGSCDGNNNIVDLNFAIKAGEPWMQIYGADVRFDEGLNDPVPPTPNAACGGAYVILPGSGGTPGVGFSGDLPPKLNLGSISSLGWLVGGVQYPSLFKPVRAKVIRTAYGYLMFAVGRGNVRTVNLSSVCNPANCTLPASLASGIYTATGNVNLNAFTFPANRDYIFLIDGTLRIKGQIRVPTTSTATFSVSEDILIDGSVGSPPSCPPPAVGAADLEGFYSADRNFIVESSPQTDCSAGIIDKQLNVQGAIVVDAGQRTPGGRFTNNRTFCTQNIDYPSFTLRARPDFILNAPEFIKRENFIWQEVAP